MLHALTVNSAFDDTSSLKPTALKSILGGGQFPLRVKAFTGNPRRRQDATHNAPVRPEAPNTAMGALSPADATEGNVVEMAAADPPMSRSRRVTPSFNMERDAVCGMLEVANSQIAMRRSESMSRLFAYVHIQCNTYDGQRSKSDLQFLCIRLFQMIEM